MTPSRVLVEQSYRVLCEGKKLPDAVVVFHADGVDFDTIDVDGRSIPVMFAHSEFGLRRALRAMENTPGVVLTSLRNTTTSHDVLARLHRHRIDDLDVTHAAATRHGFRSFEPRLRSAEGRRLGERLLRLPVGVLAGADASGVLSWERASRAVLGDALGLEPGAFTLTALLRRCLSGGLDAALAELQRDELGEVLTQVLEGDLPEGAALAASELLEHAQRDGGKAALGWAGARVAAQRATASPEHTRAALMALGQLAAGREANTIERVTAALSDALQTLELTLSADERARLAASTDETLTKVGAIGLAAFAMRSRAGQRQRWQELGHALVGAIEAARSGDEVRRRTAADAVWDAGESLARGAATALPDEDRARVEAAMRLATWLLGESETHVASDVLARHYLVHDSLLDAEREHLAGAALGDASDVNVAVSRLVAAVGERIDARNAAFATTVIDAIATGQAPAGTVLVRDVLARHVAPLAAHGPVLLVVLDGLSWAVLRHLHADLESTSSDELPLWVPSQNANPTPVLAMVPSITNLSRTALLTGRAVWGNASDEKKAFAAVCGQTAQLFHSADLRDGNVVRDAIHSKTRVVGVVLNTVDDELDGSAQATQRWTLDRFQHLATLLGAASDTGRIVVFASDHGHVLDRGDRALSGLRTRSGDDESPDRRGGARWRTLPPQPTPGEHIARAPWLQAALGVDTIVVPSAEGQHYGQPARGYHGGIARAELIAPLVVLGTPALRPAAIQAASLTQLEATPPAWWARPLLAPSPAQAPAPAEAPAPARATIRSPDAPAPAASPAPAPAPAASPLPQHPRWAAQRRLPACDENAISNNEAIQLISAALNNGGKLATTQAATLLGIAPRRIPSMFHALSELLNIDGTVIAVYDRGEGILRVNAARFAAEWG